MSLLAGEEQDCLRARKKSRGGIRIRRVFRRLEFRSHFLRSRQRYPLESQHRTFHLQPTPRSHLPADQTYSRGPISVLSERGRSVSVRSRPRCSLTNSPACSRETRSIAENTRRGITERRPSRGERASPTDSTSDYTSRISLRLRLKEAL